MTTTQTAESVALALDRRAPNLDGVSTIVQAAAMLRHQAAEIERLKNQPVLAWTDRYGYLFTPTQHEELGVGTIALIAKPEVK
jgi:hypothetical protein